MVMGSSHVGPTGGARGRSGVRHALAAAIGLAVMWSPAARSADLDDPQGLRMPDPLFSLHDMYPDLAMEPAGRAVTREFQPRSDIAVSPGTRTTIRDRSGDLQLTSAWQRLADYRSNNGIRLLTLWQATAGTIALHEGKHGGTSLQWTSHIMNRGDASRGLLDHLFSAAVRDTHQSPSAPVLFRPAVHEPLVLRTVAP